MSVQSSFTDLVFSLSDKDFRLLQDAIAARRNKEQYGVTSLKNSLFGITVFPHARHVDPVNQYLLVSLRKGCHDTDVQNVGNITHS